MWLQCRGLQGESKVRPKVLVWKVAWQLWIEREKNGEGARAGDRFWDLATRGVTALNQPRSYL
jgi:hypothetical protein